MAYCPDCAAVLAPRQTACSRCGRVLPVAPVTFTAPPLSVRTAVILLLIAWGVPLLLLLRDIAVSGARIGMAQSFAISLLWIVFILFLWQRQNWARFAIVALIAILVMNISFSILRFGGAVYSWRWAIIIAEEILRVYAAYLLFRPESNVWFKR